MRVCIGMRGSYGYQWLISFIPLRLTFEKEEKIVELWNESSLVLNYMSSRTFHVGNAILGKVLPGPGANLT